MQRLGALLALLGIAAGANAQKVVVGVTQINMLIAQPALTEDYYPPMETFRGDRCFSADSEFPRPCSTPWVKYEWTEPPEWTRGNPPLGSDRYAYNCEETSLWCWTEGDAEGCACSGGNRGGTWTRIATATTPISSTLAQKKSSEEYDCEITGDVATPIKEHICVIATSVHGDPKNLTLTLMVTRDVAQEIRAETLDAEEMLLNLLGAWKYQHDLVVGIVDVYYGKVHLATAKTTARRGDHVLFE